MEPLTHDELIALLAAAKESSIRDWCILLLMYHHGMRASEPGRLRRSDLNERDWLLNVQRRKHSISGPQKVMPDGTKLLDARKALTAWLAERPQTSGLLFPNPQGGSLSRIAVYNLFKKHAETAGIPAHKAAPHSLKHSLGQRLHDSGAPIEVVAASLGHARIDSSRRYFDLTFDEVNDARRAAIAYRG
jgi:integrase